jgi:hypothetical protein
MGGAAMSADFPFELAAFVRKTFQFDMASHVRASDPPTSREAAASRDNRMRWGSQRHVLLCAYAAHGSMTDEQAAKEAGLLPGRACFWKRCGELRDLGLIAETGETRISDSGNDVLVSGITAQGRVMLDEMEEDRED